MWVLLLFFPVVGKLFLLADCPLQGGIFSEGASYPPGPFLAVSAAAAARERQRDRGRDSWTEQANHANHNAYQPGPFTDSGYASAATGEPHQSHEEPSVIADSPGQFTVSNSNATPTVPSHREHQTQYTGESSLDGGTTCGYISDLANDLYKQLHLERRRAEWNAIEDAPALLKAFAIKVGLQDNTPSHRSVMRFIHKHST